MPNSFTSNELTITANGTTGNIAHGLGATPALVRARLVCKFADNGYSVGDVIDVAASSPGQTNTGIAVTADGTNLNARFAGNFSAISKSTNGLVKLTNSSWKVRLYAQLADSAGYTSPDQTITTNSQLTLTHGLGGAPLMCEIALVCQTAELNYSVGDVVFPMNCENNASCSGVSIKMTSTSLVCTFGNTATTGNFCIPDKSTGSVSAITNSRWKIRFYAQKAHSTATSSTSTTGITSGGSAGPSVGSTDAFTSYSLVAGSAVLGYSASDVVCPRWTPERVANMAHTCIFGGSAVFGVHNSLGQTGLYFVENLSTKSDTEITNSDWSLKVYKQAAA